MVNAQMRLRAGVQKEVELAGAMFGMPTRTEVDAAHRKIAELERALRRMRDAKPDAAPRPPPPAANASSKPAAKKAAAKKPHAKKSAVKASAGKAVESARRSAFADIAPPAPHKASKGAKR
jgi:hypothetical protein